MFHLWNAAQTGNTEALCIKILQGLCELLCATLGPGLEHIKILTSSQNIEPIALLGERVWQRLWSKRKSIQHWLYFFSLFSACYLACSKTYFIPPLASDRLGNNYSTSPHGAKRATWTGFSVFRLDLLLAKILT